MFPEQARFYLLQIMTEYLNGEYSAESKVTVENEFSKGVEKFKAAASRFGEAEVQTPG